MKDESKEVEGSTSLPKPAVEDAIKLTIEYSEPRQAILFIVEYGGYLSCWSERSVEEALGGLTLAQMDDKYAMESPMMEYGVNFNGFNYITQGSLGQAVIAHLTEQEYQFSQQIREEPELVLHGLGVKVSSSTQCRNEEGFAVEQGGVTIGLL